jgi:hypothetical protein
MAGMLNQYFLDSTRYVSEMMGAALMKNRELCRKDMQRIDKYK